MNTDAVKKRGRKPKKDAEPENVSFSSIVVDTQIEPEPEQENEKEKQQEQQNESSNEEETPKAKKRGRKPKGGKIIQQAVPLPVGKESKPNVILHLKCSLKDLVGNGVMNQGIENFAFTTNKNDLSYEIVSNPNHQEPQSYCDDDNDSDNNKAEQELTGNDKKELWRKLKQLEHNLHLNNIGDKKSA